MRDIILVSDIIIMLLS